MVYKRVNVRQWWRQRAVRAAGLVTVAELLCLIAFVLAYFAPTYHHGVMTVPFLTPFHVDVSLRRVHAWSECMYLGSVSPVTGQSVHAGRMWNDVACRKMVNALDRKPLEIATRAACGLSVINFITQGQSCLIFSSLEFAAKATRLTLVLSMMSMSVAIASCFCFLLRPGAGTPRAMIVVFVTIAGICAFWPPILFVALGENLAFSPVLLLQLIDQNTPQTTLSTGYLLLLGACLLQLATVPLTIKMMPSVLSAPYELQKMWLADTPLGQRCEYDGQQDYFVYRPSVEDLAESRSVDLNDPIVDDEIERMLHAPVPSQLFLHER